MKYQILVPVLIFMLVGCQSVSLNPKNNDMLNWKYGDLRLLDAIDAPEPDQDLIALYTRINNQGFQIRLDFLDLVSFLRKDIYIPLDTNPGGVSQIMTNDGTLSSDIYWDYLLKITDSGKVEVFDDHLDTVPGMDLFIIYDSLQDRIIISFNKSTLPIYYGKTKLQIMITPPEQAVISDKSAPFSIDAPSPSGVKVIFAFWNTFSSVTPAQTLRSWAGAHAGPMSSRHGLKYIIDAAAQNNSTIFLLDLLNPDTISALDYINVLPRIRKLTAQGTIALPDLTKIGNNGFGDFSNDSELDILTDSLDFYKLWRINTNLEDNYMIKKLRLYLLLNNYLFVNNINKIGDNDYAQYIKDKNICDLMPQFTSTGVVDHPIELSLRCKSAFLSYAILYPTTPLVLGGDFSKSVLGDPAAISAVYSYIRAHPWIQILSINDQTSSRGVIKSGISQQKEITATGTMNISQDKVFTLEDLVFPQDVIYKALQQSPKNQLTTLAWHVFSNLTRSTSPELLSLQSNYIGQIGYILTAARWVEDPRPQETCSIDLDFDGSTECILANTNIFAIIEPEGAYIPFIFAKDLQGIHQIIGPTWEFLVGLSDISAWKPALDVRGDPEQLLGAFQDSFDNWNKYNLDINGYTVSLYNEEMAMRKSFTIFPDSLHVDLHNPIQFPNSSMLPLVIDPWLRYTSGWGDIYIKHLQPFTIQWGIKAGEMVEIRSTNTLNAFSFIDTRASLVYPEDPNFDYLPGHYLPYPMSVVSINASESYSVDIIINP